MNKEESIICKLFEIPLSDAKNLPKLLKIENEFLNTEIDSLFFDCKEKVGFDFSKPDNGIHNQIINYRNKMAFKTIYDICEKKGKLEKLKFLIKIE